MAHEMEDKFSVQAVTKPLPNKVDMEAFEECYTAADVGEQRPGYTKRDQKDMYRMGKRQELMVCLSYCHPEL